VLYYLGPADIERTAALAPGGAVLLVHWTGPTNYPVSGDEAAERFAAPAPAGSGPSCRQGAHSIGWIVSNLAE